MTTPDLIAAARFTIEQIDVGDFDLGDISLLRVAVAELPSDAVIVSAALLEEAATLLGKVAEEFRDMVPHVGEAHEHRFLYLWSQCLGMTLRMPRKEPES